MVGNGEYHDASSYAAFCSKESELDLVYAPKLAVHWSNNPPVGKHEISLLDVNSSKMMIMMGKATLINVLVQNTGDYAESFKVTAYATSIGSQTLPSKAQLSALTLAPLTQKLVIGTQTVTNLTPQGIRAVTLLWQTQGCIANNYVISSTITPIAEQARIINNGMSSNQPIGLSDYGCWILVSGKKQGDSLAGYFCAECGRYYNVLRYLGYSKSDIYFLAQPETSGYDCDGDGQSEVNNNATAANLEWAITTWASLRADSNKPLFIYLNDHGSSNVFVLNPSQYLSASTLSSWLNTLESATNAPIHVIIDSCLSGSFINDLSKNNRVIVTASGTGESSCMMPDPHDGSLFSSPFWNEIKSGHSLMDSFNYACSTIYSGPTPYKQHPYLDDNGDGVGHTACLPNNYDGSLAANIYVGMCEWPFPWINQVVAKQSYAWPPPSGVTLWATVENETNLSRVSAWMQPPEWTPPSANDTRILLGFEEFQMADLHNDGNWTVTIPAANFTSHASGPCNFTFYITATQDNNDTAVPPIVNVEFTSTGMPSNDTTSPSMILERPLEESVVHGTVQVNGTATDDACLEKAELYLDHNLADSVNLQLTSTCYFEFSLDTTILANGARNVTVTAYDTSGNVGNQTITIYVHNFVHDVAVTALASSDVVVQEENVISFDATVANEGSYSETSDLSLYANGTQIATQPVTLQSGSFTTIPFTWNTAGYATGNYTLSAQVAPVPDENDTTNNELTLTDQPITIIPEFSSMLILPAFMLATLAVLVVRKRKRPDFSRE
jgi:hypothetical protein